MKKENKGSKKKKGVVAGDKEKVKAFLKIEKDLKKQMDEINWLGAGAFDEKFRIIEKMNREYAKLSEGDKVLIHGRVVSAPRLGVSESLGRAKFYKKEIEKGVFGKDLIQPLDEKGKPNPEFVEHYGVANFTPEQKEHIRDKMGRDKNREKDWRTAKK